MSNIRVAVRVRSLNKRETDNKANVILRINGAAITIQDTKLDYLNEYADSRERLRAFQFDSVYQSLPCVRCGLPVNRQTAATATTTGTATTATTAADGGGGLPRDEVIGVPPIIMTPTSPTCHQGSTITPPLSSASENPPSPLDGAAGSRGTTSGGEGSTSGCAQCASAAVTAQMNIFQDLGVDVLQTAFEGYNACIFAYGQTGTGKTHTMMGSQVAPGLIPRICQGLFDRMNSPTECQDEDDTAMNYRTTVSYFEIYNERVRDLLPDMLQIPTHSKKVEKYSLKVREHPKDGPYVQDLTQHVVLDNDSVQHLIHRGNENRTTATTHMHDQSSRSHAIFTITFTQAQLHDDLPSEIVSKINLVDLAGSERVDPCSPYNKSRLKEGANINKSLVTLGNVIKALAERSQQQTTGGSTSSTSSDCAVSSDVTVPGGPGVPTMSPLLGDGSPSYGSCDRLSMASSSSPGGTPKKRARNVYIPYRDSVLTWLLKDSLGGNAKTIMIATVSPSSLYYTETISTLRYAQRAKNIVNKPTVNEDMSVRMIRELRAEVSRLHTLLGHRWPLSNNKSSLDLRQFKDTHVQTGSLTSLTSQPETDSSSYITEKLEESEMKERELTNSWYNKWYETREIIKESPLTTHALCPGISITPGPEPSSLPVTPTTTTRRRQSLGVVVDSQLPHLVAFSEDLLSTGVLLYHIKEGFTYIGSDSSQDIILSNSPSTLEEHCKIQHQNGDVTINPCYGADVTVNNHPITTCTRLTQGDLLRLGDSDIFRFNHPQEAQKLREKRRSLQSEDRSHNSSLDSIHRCFSSSSLYSTMSSQLNEQNDDEYTILRSPSWNEFCVEIERQCDSEDDKLQIARDELQRVEHDRLEADRKWHDHQDGIWEAHETHRLAVEKQRTLVEELENNEDENCQTARKQFQEALNRLQQLQEQYENYIKEHNPQNTSPAHVPHGPHGPQHSPQHSPQHGPHGPAVKCVPLSQQTTDDSLLPVPHSSTASSSRSKSLPASPRKSVQVPAHASDMFGSGALSSSASSTLRSQLTGLTKMYGASVHELRRSTEGYKQDVQQLELTQKQQHDRDRAKADVSEKQRILEEMFRASSNNLKAQKRLLQESEATFRSDEARRYKEIAKQLEVVEKLEIHKKHLVRYIQEKQHEKLLMDTERVEPIGQSCSEESVVSAISMVQQVGQSLRSASEPRLNNEPDGRNADGRLSRNMKREGKLKRTISPSPSEAKTRSFIQKFKPSSIAEQVTARLYPVMTSKKTKSKRSRTTSPLSKSSAPEEKRQERSRSVPVLTDRQKTLGGSDQDIDLGATAASIHARHDYMHHGPVHHQDQYMYDAGGGGGGGGPYGSRTLSHGSSSSSLVRDRREDQNEQHRKPSGSKHSRQKSPLSRKRQHPVGTSQTDVRSKDSTVHDLAAKRRDFFNSDVQYLGSYNAQLQVASSKDFQHSSQYKCDILDDSSSVMSLGDSASGEKFSSYRGPLGLNRLSSGDPEDKGSVRRCRSAGSVESRSSCSSSKVSSLQRSVSRESNRSDCSTSRVSVSSSRDSSCAGSNGGTRGWRASSVGASSTCSSRSHQSKKAPQKQPGRRDNALSDYISTHQIQKRTKPDVTSSSVTSSLDGAGDAVSLKLSNENCDESKQAVEPTHQLFAQSLRGGIVGKESPTSDPCTRFNRARSEASDDSSSLPEKVPYSCRSTPDANRYSEGYYSDTGHSSCVSWNHPDPYLQQQHQQQHPYQSASPQSDINVRPQGVADDELHLLNDDLEPMVYSDDSLDEEEAAPSYSAASSSSASNLFTYTLMSSDAEQNDQEEEDYNPGASVNSTHSQLQEVELFSDDSLDHMLEVVDNMELTVLMPHVTHRSPIHESRLSDVEEHDLKSQSSEEELAVLTATDGLYGSGASMEASTITSSLHKKSPDGTDSGCSISPKSDPNDETNSLNPDKRVEEHVDSNKYPEPYSQEDIGDAFFLQQPAEYPLEDPVHVEHPFDMTHDSLDATTEDISYHQHRNFSMDSLDPTITPPTLSRSPTSPFRSYPRPISSTPRRPTSITPSVDSLDFTTASTPSDDGYGRSISGPPGGSTSLSDDTGYGRSISILSTDAEVEVDGPFLSVDSLDVSPGCQPDSHASRNLFALSTTLPSSNSTDHAPFDAPHSSSTPSIPAMLLPLEDVDVDDVLGVELTPRNANLKGLQSQTSGAPAQKRQNSSTYPTFAKKKRAASGDDYTIFSDDSLADHYDPDSDKTLTPRSQCHLTVDSPRDGEATTEDPRGDGRDGDVGNVESVITTVECVGPAKVIDDIGYVMVAEQEQQDGSFGSKVDLCVEDSHHKGLGDENKLFPYHGTLVPNVTGGIIADVGLHGNQQPVLKGVKEDVLQQPVLKDVQEDVLQQPVLKGVKRDELHASVPSTIEPFEQKCQDAIKEVHVSREDEHVPKDVGLDSTRKNHGDTSTVDDSNNVPAVAKSPFYYDHEDDDVIDESSPRTQGTTSGTNGRCSQETQKRHSSTDYPEDDVFEVEEPGNTNAQLDDNDVKAEVESMITNLEALAADILMTQSSSSEEEDDSETEDEDSSDPMFADYYFQPGDSDASEYDVDDGMLSPIMEVSSTTDDRDDASLDADVEPDADEKQEEQSDDLDESGRDSDESVSDSDVTLNEKDTGIGSDVNYDADGASTVRRGAVAQEGGEHVQDNVPCDVQAAVSSGDTDDGVKEDRGQEFMPSDAARQECVQEDLHRESNADPHRIVETTQEHQGTLECYPEQTSGAETNGTSDSDSQIVSEDSERTISDYGPRNIDNELSTMMLSPFGFESPPSVVPQSVETPGRDNVTDSHHTETDVKLDPVNQHDQMDVPLDHQDQDVVEKIPEQVSDHHDESIHVPGQYTGARHVVEQALDHYDQLEEASDYPDQLRKVSDEGEQVRHISGNKRQDELLADAGQQVEPDQCDHDQVENVGGHDGQVDDVTKQQEEDQVVDDHVHHVSQVADQHDPEDQTVNDHVHLVSQTADQHHLKEQVVDQHVHLINQVADQHDPKEQFVDDHTHLVSQVADQHGSEDQTVDDHTHPVSQVADQHDPKEQVVDDHTYLVSQVADQHDPEDQVIMQHVHLVSQVADQHGSEDQTVDDHTHPVSQVADQHDPKEQVVDEHIKVEHLEQVEQIPEQQNQAEKSSNHHDHVDSVTVDERVQLEQFTHERLDHSEITDDCNVSLKTHEIDDNVDGSADDSADSSSTQAVIAGNESKDRADQTLEQKSTPVNLKPDEKELVTQLDVPLKVNLTDSRDTVSSDPVSGTSDGVENNVFDPIPAKSSDHEAAKSSDHEAAKSSDHEAAKSSDHEAAKSSDHDAAKSSDHEAGKTSDHKAAKSSDHKAAKSSDHEAAKSSNHEAEESVFETPAELPEIVLPPTTYEMFVEKSGRHSQDDSHMDTDDETLDDVVVEPIISREELMELASASAVDDDMPDHCNDDNTFNRSTVDVDGIDIGLDLNTVSNTRSSISNQSSINCDSSNEPYHIDCTDIRMKTNIDINSSEQCIDLSNIESDSTGVPENSTALTEETIACNENVVNSAGIQDELPTNVPTEMLHGTATTISAVNNMSDSPGNRVNSVQSTVQDSNIDPRTVDATDICHAVLNAEVDDQDIPSSSEAVTSGLTPPPNDVPAELIDGVTAGDQICNDSPRPVTTGIGAKLQQATHTVRAARGADDHADSAVPPLQQPAVTGGAQGSADTGVDTPRTIDDQAERIDSLTGDKKLSATPEQSGDNAGVTEELTVHTHKDTTEQIQSAPDIDTPQPDLTSPSVDCSESRDPSEQDDVADDHVGTVQQPRISVDEPIASTSAAGDAESSGAGPSGAGVVVQNKALLAVYEDAYDQYASSFEDDISSGSDRDLEVDMDSLVSPIPSPINSPVTVDVSEQSDREPASSVASTGELFSDSDSSIQESLDYEEEDSSSSSSSSSGDDSSLRLEESVSSGQFILRASSNAKAAANETFEPKDLTTSTTVDPKELIDNGSELSKNGANDSSSVVGDVKFSPSLIGTPFPPPEVPIEENPYGYVAARQYSVDSQLTDSELQQLDADQPKEQPKVLPKELPTVLPKEPPKVLSNAKTDPEHSGSTVQDNSIGKDSCEDEAVPTTGIDPAVIDKEAAIDTHLSEIRGDATVDEPLAVSSMSIISSTRQKDMLEEATAMLLPYNVTIAKSSTNSFISESEGKIIPDRSKESIDSTSPRNITEEHGTSDTVVDSTDDNVKNNEITETSELLSTHNIRIADQGKLEEVTSHNYTTPQRSSSFEKLIESESLDQEHYSYEESEASELDSANDATFDSEGNLEFDHKLQGILEESTESVDIPPGITTSASAEVPAADDKASLADTHEPTSLSQSSIAPNGQPSVKAGYDPTIVNSNAHGGADMQQINMCSEHPEETDCSEESQKVNVEGHDSNRIVSARSEDMHIGTSFVVDADHGSSSSSATLEQSADHSHSVADEARKDTAPLQPKVAEANKLLSASSEDMHIGTSSVVDADHVNSSSGATLEQPADHSHSVADEARNDNAPLQPKVAEANKLLSASSEDMHIGTSSVVDADYGSSSTGATLEQSADHSHSVADEARNDNAPLQPKVAEANKLLSASSEDMHIGTSSVVDADYGSSSTGATLEQSADHSHNVADEDRDVTAPLQPKVAEVQTGAGDYLSPSLSGSGMIPPAAVIAVDPYVVIATGKLPKELMSDDDNFPLVPCRGVGEKEECSSLGSTTIETMTTSTELGSTGKGNSEFVIDTNMNIQEPIVLHADRNTVNDLSQETDETYKDGKLNVEKEPQSTEYTSEEHIAGLHTDESVNQESSLGEHHESYSTPSATPCTTPREHNVSNISFLSSDSISEEQNVNLETHTNLDDSETYCISGSSKDWGDFEVVHSKSPTKSATSSKVVAKKRVTDLVTSKIVLLKSSDFLELTKDMPDHEPCGISCDFVHEPTRTDVFISDDAPEVNVTNIPKTVEDVPRRTKIVSFVSDDDTSGTESTDGEDDLLESLNATKEKGTIRSNVSTASLGSMDVQFCDNIDVETVSMPDSIEADEEVSSIYSDDDMESNLPIQHGNVTPTQLPLCVVPTAVNGDFNHVGSDDQSVSLSQEAECGSNANIDDVSNLDTTSEMTEGVVTSGSTKNTKFVDSQVVGFDICPEHIPTRSFAPSEEIDSQEQKVIVGSSCGVKFALSAQSTAANHDGSHMTDFEFLGLEPSRASSHNEPIDHVLIEEPMAPCQRNLRHAELNIEVKPWMHSQCSRVGTILEKRDYDLKLVDDNKDQSADKIRNSQDGDDGDINKRDDLDKNLNQGKPDSDNNGQDKAKDANDDNGTNFTDNSDVPTHTATTDSQLSCSDSAVDNITDDRTTDCLPGSTSSDEFIGEERIERCYMELQFVPNRIHLSPTPVNHEKEMDAFTDELADNLKTKVGTTPDSPVLSDHMACEDLKITESRADSPQSIQMMVEDCLAVLSRQNRICSSPDTDLEASIDNKNDQSLESKDSNVNESGVVSSSSEASSLSDEYSHTDENDSTCSEDSSDIEDNTSTSNECSRYLENNSTSSSECTNHLEENSTASYESSHPSEHIITISSDSSCPSEHIIAMSGDSSSPIEDASTTCSEYSSQSVRESTSSGSSSRIGSTANDAHRGQDGNVASYTARDGSDDGQGDRSSVELYSSDSYESESSEAEMKSDAVFISTGKDYSSASSISEDISEATSEDGSMSPGELVLDTMDSSADICIQHSSTDPSSVEEYQEANTPDDDRAFDNLNQQYNHSYSADFILPDGSDGHLTQSGDSITYVFMDRAYSMGDVMEDSNRKNRDPSGVCYIEFPERSVSADYLPSNATVIVTPPHEFSNTEEVSTSPTDLERDEEEDRDLSDTCGPCVSISQTVQDDLLYFTDLRKLQRSKSWSPTPFCGDQSKSNGRQTVDLAVQTTDSIGKLASDDAGGSDEPNKNNQSRDENTTQDSETLRESRDVLLSLDNVHSAALIERCESVTGDLISDTDSVHSESSALIQQALATVRMAKLPSKSPTTTRSLQSQESHSSVASEQSNDIECSSAGGATNCTSIAVQTSTSLNDIPKEIDASYRLDMSSDVPRCSDSGISPEISYNEFVNNVHGSAVPSAGYPYKEDKSGHHDYPHHALPGIHPANSHAMPSMNRNEPSNSSFFHVSPLRTIETQTYPSSRVIETQTEQPALLGDQQGELNESLVRDMEQMKQSILSLTDHMANDSTASVVMKDTGVSASPPSSPRMYVRPSANCSQVNESQQSPPIGNVSTPDTNAASSPEDTSQSSASASLPNTGPSESMPLHLSSSTPRSSTEHGILEPIVDVNSATSAIEDEVVGYPNSMGNAVRQNVLGEIDDIPGYDNVGEVSADVKMLSQPETNALESNDADLNRDPNSLENTPRGPTDAVGPLTSTPVTSPTNATGVDTEATVDPSIDVQRLNCRRELFGSNASPKTGSDSPCVSDTGAQPLYDNAINVADSKNYEDGLLDAGTAGIGIPVENEEHTVPESRTSIPTDTDDQPLNDNAITVADNESYEDGRPDESVTGVGISVENEEHTVPESRTGVPTDFESEVKACMNTSADSDVLSLCSQVEFIDDSIAALSHGHQKFLFYLQSMNDSSLKLSKRKEMLAQKTKELLNEFMLESPLSSSMSSCASMEELHVGNANEEHDADVQMPDNTSSCAIIDNPHSGVTGEQCKYSAEYCLPLEDSASKELSDGQSTGSFELSTDEDFVQGLNIGSGAMDGDNALYRTPITLDVNSSFGPKDEENVENGSSDRHEDSHSNTNADVGSSEGKTSARSGNSSLSSLNVQELETSDSVESRTNVSDTTSPRSTTDIVSIEHYTPDGASALQQSDLNNELLDDKLAGAVESEAKFVGREAAGCPDRQPSHHDVSSALDTSTNDQRSLEHKMEGDVELNTDEVSSADQLQHDLGEKTVNEKIEKISTPLLVEAPAPSSFNEDVSTESVAVDELLLHSPIVPRNESLQEEDIVHDNGLPNIPRSVSPIGTGQHPAAEAESKESDSGEVVSDVIEQESYLPTTANDLGDKNNSVCDQSEETVSTANTSQPLLSSTPVKKKPANGTSEITNVHQSEIEEINPRNISADAQETLTSTRMSPVFNQSGGVNADEEVVQGGPESAQQPAEHSTDEVIPHATSSTSQQCDSQDNQDSIIGNKSNIRELSSASPSAFRRISRENSFTQRETQSSSSSLHQMDKENSDNQLKSSTDFCVQTELNSSATCDQSIETNMCGSPLTDDLEWLRKERKRILDMLARDVMPSKLQVDLAEAQLNYIIGQTDTLLHSIDDPTSWDHDALKDITNPKHQLSEISKVYLARYRETLEKSRQEIDNRIVQLEYERETNQSVYSDSSFTSASVTQAMKQEAKEHSLHLSQLKREAELEAFMIEREREQMLHSGRRRSSVTGPRSYSPSVMRVTRTTTPKGTRSPRTSSPLHIHSPRSRSDSPAVRSYTKSSRTSSPQHSPKSTSSSITPRQHRDHFAGVRRNFLGSTTSSRSSSPGLLHRPTSALSYTVYVDQHPLSYSLTARQMERPASVPASEFCSSMLSSIDQITRQFGPGQARLPLTDGLLMADDESQQLLSETQRVRGHSSAEIQRAHYTLHKRCPSNDSTSSTNSNYHRTPVRSYQKDIESYRTHLSTPQQGDLQSVMGTNKRLDKEIDLEIEVLKRKYTLLAHQQHTSPSSSQQSHVGSRPLTQPSSRPMTPQMRTASQRSSPFIHSS